LSNLKFFCTLGILSTITAFSFSLIFHFCQTRSRGQTKFRDAGKNRSGADINAERGKRHLRLSHHLARTLPATFFHEKYTTPHVALARRSD
jgi:hypothetical protein